MKKSLFLLVWLLMVLIPVSYAQPEDARLKQQLQGKRNLADLINTVNAYYKNPETINRLGADAVNRELKRWKRYEWYMSSRLGPNGEFVNINQKTIEATGLQQRRNASMNEKGNGITSSTATWVPVGPLNTTSGIGRVDRLAFHPTNASIVYAGTTTGGLWRTTDAGANWTNLSADIPSPGISGIVIDPTNTNTIYILTGDGDSDISGLVEDYGYMRLSIGVLKSTDGGSTWTKMGEFPGADYSTLVGYRLVMHPTNNNILYACTSQGIFISVNAGVSWGLNNGNGRFYNMVFRPGSNNICYATGRIPGSSRASFWRSTSSGLIWDSINTINNQINNPTSRVELAVAPSNSNVVYLLCGGIPGNGQFKGLYRSDDMGLTFNLQSNTPNILGRANDGSDNANQSNYDLTVAVSNTTSATVVTGAIEVWRSLNSGVNWVYRGALHDDVHDLGFHPVDNKLWAATDGGVYSSTDNGATWTSHFEDMNITQFYRLAVKQSNYLDMIGGAQDNSVKRRTGSTSTFDHIACCDGFAVDYDFADEDILYAVTNQSINRSTNGGDNFASITPPNSNNPFSMSMAVHTSLGNALFIGSDSIWRTTNAANANNWTVSPGIQGGWFIRTCPSNGNRVYAAGGGSYNATAGSLRRSDDGGVTWPAANILSNNPGFSTNYTKITSINVDPTNSLRVWVTIGGYTANEKVYYSSDGGNNWVNRSGTLPNLPVNCIAIDNNNNAYIGTDNGVYYRGTGMSDWVPFYNNLPYVPVTELIISEADNRIRAATFGRGIWGSDLYSTCAANLNITGTLEGQEFHEASNNIVSTASLLPSEGTKVQMRGGNEVLLQAGFTASETTQFRALIGPCGSGGVAGFKLAAIDSSTKLEARKLLSPADGKKATLHVFKNTNSSAQLQIDQKASGELDILLTDEMGTVHSTKTITSSPVGKHTISMNLPNLPAGIYYLNVLVDKRFEHRQELTIQ